MTLRLRRFGWYAAGQSLCLLIIPVLLLSLGLELIGNLLCSGIAAADRKLNTDQPPPIPPRLGYVDTVKSRR